MGCHSFALLFDDINPCMCQADRDVFPSLAQAQATVANEVYRELGQPSIFLFCPTGTTCSCAAPASPPLGARCLPALAPRSRQGCPSAGCAQHLGLLRADCPDTLHGSPPPSLAPAGAAEMSGLAQDQAADGLALQQPCMLYSLCHASPSPSPLTPGRLSSPGPSAPQGMLCALSPEYCSSLCSPSPSQSCYLLTLGQELLPGIGVIWTGEHLAPLCGVCTLARQAGGQAGGLFSFWRGRVGTGDLTLIFLLSALTCACPGCECA